MLGFRDDVATVLGAADAIAVPSVHPDPLPNAALEAAAVGMPLVASRCGGLPEIVRDRETGLLVAPGDPGELAAALGELARDPDLARRLGEAAARDVRERFAPEPMFAALHAQYDAVLAERDGRGARRRARRP
jgi:glycosyltransferase involved in cell wall biosynthesis